MFSKMTGYMSQKIASGLLGHERMAYIDIAKGLLIILVVFGHAWQAVYNNGILHDADIYHLVDGWIYSFHMPAFFFLSGLFALQSAKRSIGKFIIIKIRTIAYPFLLWSVLQLSLQILMAGNTTNTMSFKNFLKIPIDPVMQFWFFYALFFIFLFFIFIKQITSSRVFFLGVGVMLFVLFQLDYVPGFMAFIYLASYFIYFSSGIFCSDFFLLNMVEDPPGNGRLFFFTLLLFLLSLIVQPLSGALPSEIHSWLLPLVALPGINFVLFASLFLFSISKILSNFFRFLGNRSLEIFVAHTIFSAGFRIAVIRIAEVQPVSIHLLGATAAGLVGPLLLVYFADRFGIQYIFRWPSRT